MALTAGRLGVASVTDPTVVGDVPRCHLGEGPLWDAESGRLYLVDIEGCAIHRYDPTTRACETHPTGERVGFAVLDEAGRIVAGLGGAVCELDFGTPGHRVLARPDMHQQNRFNDAACDPRGRLFAGTMHIEARRDRAPTGGLYRWDTDGLTTVEPMISLANGLGWSPDGRVMYFVDTHEGTVWAYDYDLATGAAARRQPFATVDIEIGVPDGITVDVDGRVYVAIWRGARINVYSPAGALDEVIAMPVANPTSCCFGGADLRTLFVTTAQGSAESHPFSGRLFQLRRDHPGLPGVRLRR